MTIIKKCFLFAIVISIFSLSACKKDCTPPVVEENIIGTWSVSFSDGLVEFKEDGTLIDPDDALLSVNGGGTKSWEITGDELTLSATGGGATLTAPLLITSNECDKIKFEVIGFTTTLSRQ